MWIPLWVWKKVTENCNNWNNMIKISQWKESYRSKKNGVGIK